MCLQSATPCNLLILLGRLHGYKCIKSLILLDRRGKMGRKLSIPLARAWGTPMIGSRVCCLFCLTSPIFHPSSFITFFPPSRAVRLAPGSQHGQREFGYVLERVLPVLGALPLRPCWLRVDNGHDASENRARCHEEDVDFVMKWNRRQRDRARPRPWHLQHCAGAGAVLLARFIQWRPIAGERLRTGSRGPPASRGDLVIGPKISRHEPCDGFRRY